MKKFKRILALVLAIMTVVSTMSVGVIAADTDNCPIALARKEHTVETCDKAGVTYTAQLTIEATCDEVGYIIYTCDDCGEEFADAIPAKGHKYETVIIEDAQCTIPGSKKEVCSVCGDETAPIEIRSKGHVWTEVLTKAPTYIEDGLVTFTCKSCGLVKEVVVEALCEHDWEPVLEVEPTCTTNGSHYHIHCTKCDVRMVEDKYVTEEEVILPALGHTGEWVKDSENCTTITYKQTCPVCGTVTPKTEDKENAEHTWVPTLNDVSVTATYNRVLGLTDGWNVHKFQCGGEALIYRYCSVCNEFETKEVEFDGHVWAVDTTKTPADICLNGGILYEYCLACGALEDGQYVTTKTTKIEAGKGHTWEEVERVEATCANGGKEGYITYGCTTCYARNDVVIPVPGHVYETITVPATCAAASYTCKECVGCGERIEVSDPIGEKNPDGHVLVEEIIIEPTCTSVGQKMTYCLYCDDFDEIIEEVPALGHTEKIQRVVPATCQSEGVIYLYCTACEEEYTETIEKIECNKVVVKVIPATCNTYEVIIEKCTMCGATYTRENKDAGFAKHTLDDGAALEVVREATCSNNGLGKGECQYCGDTIFVTIPALKHDWRPIDGSDETEEYLAPIDRAYCGQYARAFEKCANRDCGAYRMVDYEAAPAEAHNWVEDKAAYVAPTCQAEGNRHFDCENCWMDEDEAVAKTAHKSEKTGEWFTACGEIVCGDKCEMCGYTHTHVQEEIAPQTCYSYESLVHFCLDCDKAIHTEIIGNTMNEHDYSVLVSEVKPTCQKEGVQLYACSTKGCTETKTVSVAKINCDIDTQEWVVVRPATATQMGIEERACTMCGKTERRAIDNNKQHFEFKYELNHVDAIDGAYEIDNDSIVNSGVVALTIKTNASIDLNSVLLKLEYDPSVLTFRDYANENDDFVGNFLVGNPVVTDKNGKITEAYINIYAIATAFDAKPEESNITLSGEEVFVTLYFDVADDANGKNIEFTLSQEVEVSKVEINPDGSINPVILTTGVKVGTAGDVIVPKTFSATANKVVLLGDLNDNGSVTGVDHLAMKLNVLQGVTENSVADINKDGTVDVFDYVIMGQYLAGMITKDQYLNSDF